MKGRVFRNGEWTCKHKWTYSRIGKLHFRTCTACKERWFRSDGAEEWTFIKPDFEYVGGD